MSINSVTSFRGTDLNALVAEPPASSVEPIASKPLEPDTYEKQGSSTGKKVAWSAVTLAAIATTLGVLSKNGKLFNELLTDKPAEGFLNKTKYYIAKAGEWLSEKAGIGKLQDWVCGFFKKSENTPKPQGTEA